MYFGMIWPFEKFIAKYVHFENQYLFTNENHKTNEILG